MEDNTLCIPTFNTTQVCTNAIFVFILYDDNNDGERTLRTVYVCNSLINMFPRCRI